MVLEQIIVKNDVNSIDLEYIYRIMYKLDSFSCLENDFEKKFLKWIIDKFSADFISKNQEFYSWKVVLITTYKILPV